MNPQKILITGGTGYVGGRIAQYLAQFPEFDLRLTSRKSTPVRPDWLDRGELVQWNVSDPVVPSSLCEGVDTVVHLAAMNEIDCAQDPLGALQVNGVCSVRLLQAAQTAGVRRFIYFSTAHIYGAPLAGGITESTLPRPQHPYAITHKVTEDFVLAARDQGKIDGLVLRLSNGFGVPVAAEVNRWTLLINDLCRQAVTTGALVLRSSGLQRRDFITLVDVARCVDHLIRAARSECADGLFNLGGEYVRSVYEITQLVATRCEAVLGFLPPIQRVSPQPGEEAPQLDYSIAKLKSTGFVLQGGVEQEIDATLKFCSQAFGRSQG